MSTSEALLIGKVLYSSTNFGNSCQIKKKSYLFIDELVLYSCFTATENCGIIYVTAVMYSVLINGCETAYFVTCCNRTHCNHVPVMFSDKLWYTMGWEIQGQREGSKIGASGSVRKTNSTGNYLSPFLFLSPLSCI